ncbi:hypothetical protein COT97_01215 [Candidatus Falkowbacteria bacterium CG10_big_fil_rev_8_21_14_0_10_39_11]|uniref:Uncharacterized protein n=1 Tax=Candidatus Falkowbacteria bacterium CG10_big_fil_rev_8_21_14_0_10_39_11 TaxID=1974565 RepID=A0A2H0V5R6_9BACT|nr:MAG: hypothetical protein COT97_01215 [Candidatus Falkowbacteria bacterium CG10_big_fil_rev_8_21_14_0_10_39_11]
MLLSPRLFRLNRDKKNIFFYYLAASLALLVIDRVSKLSALEKLQDSPGVFVDLGSKITVGLKLSLNQALALSIPMPQWLIIGLSVFFLSLIGFVISKLVDKNQMHLAGWWYLLLVLAISNLYDRIIYTGVIDFLSVNINNWYSTIFNFADVVIVVTIMVIIKTLITNQK